jgi:DNA-directed RNA polymerase II subunit RPB2
MLLKRRRAHEIDHDVALAYIQKDCEFAIHTDGGRVIKPFIIIDEDGLPLIFRQGMMNLSFDRLCELGVIEWLDIWEAMNHFSVAYSIGLIKRIMEQRKLLTHRLLTLTTYHSRLLSVAQTFNINGSTRTDRTDPRVIDITDVERKMERVKLELTRINRKRYTHVDIDPNLALGAAASIIPWADRNQGPRNSFQCSMGRQAMGQNHSNYNLHFPTTGKFLTYPQRSIAATQMQSQFGLDDLPAGHNVVLAICTDDDNEEDAVTVKKEALERGLFNYLVVNSYSTVVKNPIKISNGEIIESLTRFVPPKPGEPFSIPRHKPDDYQHLDKNGIVRVGSLVRPGDCLIHKFKIVKSTTKGANSKVLYHRRDASVYVDLWESGVVDYVKITTNANHERIIRVRVAKSGRPIVGDKLATRQAQKSTIGRIVSEIDLPSTATGITPDIIINPHAIPKRMTVATYIEILTSKFAAMSGTRVNATSFRDFPIDTYRKMLSIVYGFSDSGEEDLFLFSGEKVLKCRLMIGPSYYQLLRHQVLSKYQYRGEGTRHLLTRLPPQGRKRCGGIRFGEQEQQSVLGHGAVHMLHDRTLNTCDAHTVIVCVKCNNVAIADIARDIIICRSCDGTKFGKCIQAYTQTLMSHYCATVGIRVLPSYAPINQSITVGSSDSIISNDNISYSGLQTDRSGSTHSPTVGLKTMMDDDLDSDDEDGIYGEESEDEPDDGSEWNIEVEFDPEVSDEEDYY